MVWETGLLCSAIGIKEVCFIVITVKEVGYLEFKKLLRERYGKNWMQWIAALCPDGILTEELVLMADLDDTAQKLGWKRLVEKGTSMVLWINEI